MTKLSSIAEINPKLNARLADEVSVSFLGMADVSELGATTRGEPRRYRDVAKGYTPFRRGDVLVAKITPCFQNGKIAQAETEHEFAFGSTEFHVIRPDLAVADPRYVLHFLRTPDVREAGERRMTGSGGQRRVPRGYFDDVDVPLPPLQDQRHIAAILDQADELRAKRRHTLALLDELRAEVLVSVGHRKQVPLADHLAFLTSGSRGWARYYANEGTPFLRIQNVRKDRLSTADLVRVEAPSSAEADRTRVQVGDVLLSITADLGRSAVVTPDLAGANVSQHLALLRLKGIAPRYVSAYLSSPTGLRQLMKMNRGATKQGLNFDDVRSILIPQLADEEQAEVVRQLEAIDESASRADAHLVYFDELFASFQHRAFTGQL